VFSLVVVWGCAPKGDPSNNGEGGPDEIENNEPDKYAEGFTWTADADCMVCHKIEANLLLDTRAGAHITEQGNKCVDCHKATEISGLHDGKTSKSKTPLRLMKTDIYEDTCFNSGCHDTKAAIAAKTTGSTVLKDKEGTVVNPHDPPDNKHHNSPYNITCSNCHVMHKEVPIAESAYLHCTGCHHDDVFLCGTVCHTQRM